MPGGKRVLIVDDNAELRASLRMLLEVWGHQVDEAGDGQTAIDMTRACRPEVVLLDLGMPGTDGCDVAKRIRAAPGGDEPYIVALTGWGRTEDQRRAREAGFDCYLLKPADPEQLRGLLEIAPVGGNGAARQRSR